MADGLQLLVQAMKSKSDAVARLGAIACSSIAGAIHESVVRGTPVDTGAARSNWIISLDAPFSDFIEPYAYGSHLGIGEQSNASAAISQGQTVLAGVRSGSIIYIQNNTPYIGLLNDGSSRQAPALFVELGIHAGIRTGIERFAKIARGLLS